MPDTFMMQATAQRSAGRPLLAGFAAALFTSAFLLFSVEPMVSRLVLPRLGGSPSVWTTCMCFFQAALLLGYAYADVLVLKLRPRRQVMVHGAVLVAALALMPLNMGHDAPPALGMPALWLLGRLTVRLGLPFVAMAATAPLLQSWFSRTNHKQANDPYFLYAASNAGSLLALLLYPIAMEPGLDLSQQVGMWSLSFVGLAAAVIACGAAALRYPGAPALPPQAATLLAPSPARRRQARWVALAFVPSGLLLAVTTYITTDIASAPLFWLLPLAIYILTFVVAFGRSARALPRGLATLQVLALAAAGVAALTGAPGLLALFIALLVFGVTALVCHMELARDRPDPVYLTRFFLLTAVGGALGGILNALVAPLIFQGPWEYPLLLIAACIVRPQAPEATGAALVAPVTATRWARVLLLLLGGIAMVYAAGPHAPPGLRPYGQAAGIIIPVAALMWLSRRGAFLGVGLASLLVLPLALRADDALLARRSFFGIYRVFRIPAEQITVLQHGTTLHGVQGDRPLEGRVPLGYYNREGPFGALFAVLRARPGGQLKRVAILGLGTGALGCYARPGEAWSFREIDPVVERLARDDRYFHFMKLCNAAAPVILGDARVTLAADPGKYDLIVVDVFSSDSVPVHLMTREALRLYMEHLNPGGIIAYHISNRYLNLAPVVARVATDAHAPVRHVQMQPMAASRRYSGAELMAVALPGGDLAPFAAAGWDVPAPGPVLWTDERSDIFSVIRW